MAATASPASTGDMYAERSLCGQRCNLAGINRIQNNRQCRSIERAKNLCRKSYRPEGAYMMNGAMPMEMIAMITPLIRPTRTSPLSLSFF